MNFVNVYDVLNKHVLKIVKRTKNQSTEDTGVVPCTKGPTPAPVLILVLFSSKHAVTEAEHVNNYFMLFVIIILMIAHHL